MMRWMRYFNKKLLINPGLRLAHGLKMALTPTVDHDLRVDYEIDE